MKFINSRWERIYFSMTPTQLRIGLAMLSIIALVLGGAADDQWDG